MPRKGVPDQVQKEKLSENVKVCFAKQADYGWNLKLIHKQVIFRSFFGQCTAGRTFGANCSFQSCTIIIVSCGIQFEM